MRLSTGPAAACLALACVLAAAAVDAQTAEAPATVAQVRPEAQRSDARPTQNRPAVLSTIAIGFVLATIGAGAIITAAAYWKAGGATLLSFGLLTFLSGLSMLISAGPLVPLFNLPRRPLQFSSAIIVYLIPVPGLFYAERIRGRGWRSSLHWLWRVALVMAIVFAIRDLIAGAPWTSLPLYRIFMIIVMIVLLPHVILWRHQDPFESAVRMIGTLVLGLSILHDNLVGFDLFPWRVSLTSYGMGVFVLGLGFVTARVFFADQREFAAVERELETARSIQTSILPRSVPSVTGLDVAVRYVPARQVAGDVYDFLPIDDRRLCVLVADAAGHGVPAALIASMATVAFSSHPALAEEPGEILREMNRVFSAHSDSRFVTAACFFFDTRCGMVRYSLAGHPWPLLWKKRTRRIEELTEGGFVLGVFRNATYPTGEVSFEAGDRLILYTDGLSEARDAAGDWFGDRELKTFMSEEGGEPTADRCADALLARLEHWSGRGTSGRPFEDDLTIAVIDRL
jgi:sigma-B regulation protein RsbU (phosphoserine phosphatase)